MKDIAIPVVLLKVVVAYVIAGLLLAILVPFLHNHEIELSAWMVWTVIVGVIVVCAGPDIYRHFRRHAPQ